MVWRGDVTDKLYPELLRAGRGVAENRTCTTRKISKADSTPWVASLVHGLGKQSVLDSIGNVLLNKRCNTASCQGYLA